MHADSEGSDSEEVSASERRSLEQSAELFELEGDLIVKKGEERRGRGRGRGRHLQPCTVSLSYTLGVLTPHSSMVTTSRMVRHPGGPSGERHHKIVVTIRDFMR